MSIQSSIDTLKLENDELTMTIIFSQWEKDIKEGMTMLRSTIGIVGDSADDMRKGIVDMLY